MTIADRRLELRRELAQLESGAHPAFEQERLTAYIAGLKAEKATAEQRLAAARERAPDSREWLGERGSPYGLAASRSWGEVARALEQDIAVIEAEIERVQSSSPA